MYIMYNMLSTFLKSMIFLLQAANIMHIFTLLPNFLKCAISILNDQCFVSYCIINGMYTVSTDSTSLPYLFETKNVCKNFRMLKDA